MSGFGSGKAFGGNTTIKKKRELVFETSDLVMVQGHDEYMDVVGVLHDDERLFVSCATKQEFEVPFSAVEMQFERKKI